MKDSGNDPGFVREMIDQFKISTLDGLREIRSELKHAHYSAVGDLAHKLAPASRHLKITKLLGTLKEIERCAENKNRNKIVTLLDKAEVLTEQAAHSLDDQYEKLNT